MNISKLTLDEVKQFLYWRSNRKGNESIPDYMGTSESAIIDVSSW